VFSASTRGRIPSARIFKNRDLTRLPLTERRAIMRTVLKFRLSRIHITDYFETSATDMLRAVQEQRLEGVVAKRRDSVYEPGKRTGAWIKYRVNRGKELAIGGYIPGPHGVDSIIVGYYNGENPVYVARVRSGLVPASRRQLFHKLRTLAIPECAFINLPESGKGRWSEGLTADVMKTCVWVGPEFVAQIEFLEWTEGDHLRHARFVGLRDDKDARHAVKEQTEKT